MGVALAKQTECMGKVKIVRQVTSKDVTERSYHPKGSLKQMKQ